MTVTVLPDKYCLQKLSKISHCQCKYYTDTLMCKHHFTAGSQGQATVNLTAFFFSVRYVNLTQYIIYIYSTV